MSTYAAPQELQCYTRRDHSGPTPTTPTRKKREVEHNQATNQ